MISIELANYIIAASLLVSLCVYVWFSKREGTFLNILTPVFIIEIPSNFLLPLAYIDLFGTGYTTYAYIYVYGTLALKSIAFVVGYAYRNRKDRPAPKAFAWTNRYFASLSVICLGVAAAIFSEVLFEFKDLIRDPREIYRLTRTGFGQQTFVSSTLADLAIVFILFSRRSWLAKTFVIAGAMGIIFLHGSKSGSLDVLFLLLLFQIYVTGRKISVVPAMVSSILIVTVIVVLFAVTMPLGDGPAEALEALSQYSDYTRNAMLVIDSHLPVQYGRLTLEANTYSLIPRVLMPSKPKNFGPFYLDDEFYPGTFDEDVGAPAFGVGVQYADFGYLAVIYVLLFAVFEGYLASVFVGRLKATKHPADFLVLIFLGGVSLFPLGAGWLLPEVLVLAVGIRYLSRFGVSDVFRRSGVKQGVVRATQT